MPTLVIIGLFVVVLAAAVLLSSRGGSRASGSGSNVSTRPNTTDRPNDRR
jgi:hypothetical protein